MHNSSLNSVLHQGVDVVDVKFAHQPCAVRFNGFYGKVQVLSDLSAGLAFGDHLKDLSLSERQRVIYVAAQAAVGLSLDCFVEKR